MIYDDAFEVKETRYGLFISYRLDGSPMVTGLTEQAVVESTRFDLKAEIDGTLFTGDNVRIVGSSVVDGKL